MTLTKQQRQSVILSGLLAVLAFTLYNWYAGSAGSPGTASVAVSSSSQERALDLKDLYLKKNPRKSAVKKEISFRDIDPSIHLEKLEEFDPGSPLNTRNMFSVEVARERNMAAGSVRPGSGPGPSGAGVPGSQATPLSRPAATPMVIINLKFFGTKTDVRHKSRQGFFADGDEVYLASEGELVANRYRILRIGDTSAEIEELSSKTRRQISLQ
ncbi:MAG: hypothetical protein FJW26_06110 [Acidimicrobiia bacterium]|nr:hypothetical protein [Acidimicrobiia bacterium]